jgi:hypothetical protein
VPELPLRETENMTTETHAADCGLPYAHHPHLYRTTKRGKVKACDGSITKRVTG